MKRYYITWDEKRNGTQETYRTWETVSDRREVKDMVLVEQNYRRRNGLPHMFHVIIGQACPDVACRFKTLYISRKECNQEQVLEIKDFLYKTGAIR